MDCYDSIYCPGDCEDCSFDPETEGVFMYWSEITFLDVLVLLAIFAVGVIVGLLL